MICQDFMGKKPGALYCSECRDIGREHQIEIKSTGSMEGYCTGCKKVQPFVCAKLAESVSA